MKIYPKNKRNLLKAALGELQSDLLIKNVRLVNVITGEVYPASVYVYDGMIAHVEWHNPEDNTFTAEEVIDGEGKFLIPGLVDSHVHIESSMMTPRNFAKAVIPHGTTTVITDPHEIGNVYGVEGVRYMHDAGSNLPMCQYIDIPSCVPSVPGLENAGADFGASEIEELAGLERVIGLAEVMSYIDVIHGEDRMMDILDVAEKHGLYLQGHAPFLTGRELSAYLCAGPNTCHETRDAGEAIEKYRSGMRLDARDSSITKNVKEVWNGVKDCKFFDNLSLCTDDREADDILNNGQLNEVVRSAIKAGMEPIAAIKSATWNSAREAGITNLGAIAPGYAADMLIVDDLRSIHPSCVIYRGKLVARDGKLTAAIEDKKYPLEKRNSVTIKELSEDDFTIKVQPGQDKVKVNVMRYYDLNLSTTQIESRELPVVDGKLKLDEDLKFVAVVNRYEGNDNIALGLVSGFGTKKGALASTVSHDSHNLTIVYDKPEDALAAANALKACGGGMCAALDGKILHTLELPLGGLISLKPAEELAIDSAQMKDAIRQLGLTEMENPLLRIVTLALPVIPEAKMSDLGLVKVSTKELVPLFVQ
ncbi:adenine deaminase [Clostridium sp. C105KSO13]|uniref:adenine deaminase n=1 Tax=Clostridium sp. C105KSO13 TaxID=1776045 RepID=UPI0007406528|nr:adenine deaminase [Clostridium sp. C105KSO13]CUX48429.1 Adenine deaminase [Clostridium sp. C105KSO13]